MLVSFPPVFTTLPALSGKEKKTPKQTREGKKSRELKHLYLQAFIAFQYTVYCRNLSTKVHWQTCRWKENGKFHTGLKGVTRNPLPPITAVSFPQKTKIYQNSLQKISTWYARTFWKELLILIASTTYIEVRNWGIKQVLLFKLEGLTAFLY